MLKTTTTTTLISNLNLGSDLEPRPLILSRCTVAKYKVQGSYLQFIYTGYHNPPPLTFIVLQTLRRLQLLTVAQPIPRPVYWL